MTLTRRRRLQEPPVVPQRTTVATTLPGLPNVVADPDDWLLALCAQADPDAWYPEKGESCVEAKKICGRCPLARQCLAEALENDERFGVWGGTSAQERKKILKANDGRDDDWLTEVLDTVVGPAVAPAAEHVEDAAPALVSAGALTLEAA